MDGSLKRRLVSIPAVVVGWLLLTVLLVPTVLVVALIDLVRGHRRLPLARLVGFGWWYLGAETVGLVALGASWLLTLGRPSARVDQAYAIQDVWAGALFGALRRLFGIRFEVDEGGAELSAGPYVVMMRHASIVDTLLPAFTLARPHGIRLRYVLKAELLADPCLDVAGNRLPNVFVRRGGGRSEVPRVAALAEGLPPSGAVLIYPEGTRFTDAKRSRLMERGGRIGERARALAAVLPPRPGGPGALLRAGHDVVFFAHRGLEGLAEVKDLLDGALIDARVRVAMWRVAASEVDLDDVDGWLFGQWRRMDDWVVAASAAD
jgi:1-acyl-sn-glycerol-3-phosphate acyltransferase